MDSWNIEAERQDCVRTEASAAVVLAAGQGRRMGSDVAKQFLMLNGKPLIYYSLAVFERSPVDTVILVTGADEIEYCRREIVERYHFQKVRAIVAGGKERYHSVYQGLCAVNKSQAVSQNGIVLIHDGARPLVSLEIIERAIEGARKYHACVAAMPVKDTIKIVDRDGFSAGTPDRSTLWQMQTPQAFSYHLIFSAYKKLLSREEYQVGVTDDAMVVESMTDTKVKMIRGDYSNMKVTTPEDMITASAFLGQRPGLI